VAGTKVVVIGGGIAGVSAAYALCRHPSRPAVTVIEAEAQLAHHTTGRSAAQLIENYGTGPIRALTKASLDYFHRPPSDLVEHDLLERRGVLTVAGAGQGDAFDRALAEGAAVNPTIGEITPAEAAGLFPALRPELIERAMHEPESADIDVAGLHQSFVRGIRAAGGTIATTCRAQELRPSGSGWRISTTAAELDADLVVNAAGAWADDVAARAGLRPVGLRPLRRTAFMVPSRHDGSERWPLVADVEHRWYAKPDGRQFLCSPADETPSEPCDAKPEEIDVARAIDLVNRATTLDIRTVRSSWAGLRTFAPDRTMVIGADPEGSGFIWCAGQGGTGIQTAPAAGQLVADLVFDGRPGPTFDGVDLALDELGPARFSPAGDSRRSS
jgi:D-arginine dehydrogenase